MAPQNALESIKEQLQREWNALNAKAAVLRSEILSLESEQEPIHAAIEALSGTTSPRISATPLPNRKKPRPAASKAQVKDLAAVELSQHHGIPEEELKKLVEQRVIASGFSLLGFSLRFKEAFNELNSNGSLHRNN